MSATTAVRVATAQAYQLAEGPVWDAARRRLLWVDIEAGAVLEGMLVDERIEVTRRHDFDGMVGAVAVSADGDLLVAAQERLVVLRSDGSKQNGPPVIPAGQRRRLNDGGIDPAGRFLVGTLSLDGASRSEVLVRLEPDWSLTVFDDDLTLSNGVSWSSDGRLMYNVDTLRRTIFVRDYDPSAGYYGKRRVHLRIEDGWPDGIAVDSADGLWVALWGAGQVRRYAPDGSLAHVLPVPAPHTSSLVFADNDLRTLVITSAAAELSDIQLARYPESGRLFTTRVDVPGQPVPAWAGCPAV
jgi:sugar lactone lactonase YvrE